MCKNGEKFFDFSKFSTADKWYLFGRCLFGTIAYGGYVYALKLIPLYLTTIMFNTIPFWSAILGYFINNESVSKILGICIIGCFAGIVVIMLAKIHNSDSEQSGEK
jgi:drug/metabolite transporter (DMT)-like permease